MSGYDFSTAEPPRGDTIPAKTIVPVIVAVIAGDDNTPENAFHLTKSGIWQLSLEFTVTEGPFAKRKLWERLTMGAPKGKELSDGQLKAVAISSTRIRSMLEAVRGFLPTDESPAAIEARKIGSLFDLDNLEFWIEVGIEKGTEQYPADKNTIGKVLPFGSTGAVAGAAPARVAAVAAPAAKKAAPSWAQ